MAEVAGAKLPLMLKPSAADGMLINLVGAILVSPMIDPDVLGDCLTGIGRALPKSSKDSILMGDLSRAAAELVAAYPERGSRAPEGRLNRWARARFDAGVALAELLRWRGAECEAQAFSPSEGV